MGVHTEYVNSDRHYVDDDTGIVVPGVSAILDMYPKPAIPPWAAREAAIFCVDNQRKIQELSARNRFKAIDMVKGAPWKLSKKASRQGTVVHDTVEAILLQVARGEQPTGYVPKGTMPYLRQFARFMKEFQAKPILVETVVWNGTHLYAGRIDATYEIIPPDTEKVRKIGWKPGVKRTEMVDIKTGKGVYSSAALQQVAYRNAERYYDPIRDKWFKMPRTSGASALHLHSDGFSLVPLLTEIPEWNEFLTLRQSYNWKVNREKHAVGDPINAKPLKKPRWKG